MKLTDFQPGLRVYVKTHHIDRTTSKALGTVGRVLGKEMTIIVKFDSGHMVEITEGNAHYFNLETPN